MEITSDPVRSKYPVAKFPYETTTRLGTVVTILGFNQKADRPWYGYIEAEVDGKTIHNNLTWLLNGRYNEKEERALDLTKISF